MLKCVEAMEGPKQWQILKLSNVGPQKEGQHGMTSLPGHLGNLHVRRDTFRWCVSCCRPAATRVAVKKTCALERQKGSGFWS